MEGRARETSGRELSKPFSQIRLLHQRRELASIINRGRAPGRASRPLIELLAIERTVAVDVHRVEMLYSHTPRERGGSGLHITSRATP